MLRFLVLLLSGLLAWQALPCAAQAPAALRLNELPMQERDQHLAYWRDASGQLGVEAVARSHGSAFTPLTRRLSLGFTADVVWLRFSLQAPDPTGVTLRQLEVQQPLLEDVRLFAPDGAGGFHELGGDPAQGLAAGARVGTRAEFALRLLGSAPQTYYLRLASRTALATGVRVWRPEALRLHQFDQAFIWGSFFGVYALVFLFFGMFWFWTRERVHSSYAAYTLVNLLAAFFSGGWPARWWPEVPRTVWTDWLGLWICLALVLGVHFSVAYLRLDRRWPRYTRLGVRLCLVWGAVSALAVLGGYYRLVIPLIQVLSMLGMVLLVLLALLRIRQGDTTARYYLAAFVLFYCGVCLRYLVNLGVLEPRFWSDNSYQWGAFLHVLVLSLGIFSGYNQLRREKQVALERATVEARQRVEQGDFMALVSHEFRSPLTIVSASADNLLSDPQLDERARKRVEKIVRATQRMGTLLDTYLTKERVLLDAYSLVRKPNDLALICRKARDEAAEAGPVEDIGYYGLESLELRCDADLVRIAVLNLVTNACRHSRGTAPVEIELRRNASHAQVLVRDDGAGVPPDEQELVFQRFYRGRNALDRPGAGLGLYLVRGVAERHGGRVRVHNLPQGGCEFCMELPLTEVTTK